jgi:hypothetical protein
MRQPDRHALNYGANGEISVDFYNNAGVLLKQQNNQADKALDTRHYASGAAFETSYASYQQF